MHRYQGNVSFRQIAVHMISRCLAKCYRFFLPRKMRDPLRRYRQVYLSILLFALFNIAFWAGFLSSRLSYEQRTTDLSDVHTLSEGQSKQEDLQILRKQWEMNNRRKLDNLKFHKRKRKLKYKYYDGANPTGSSGEQRDGGQSRNNEVNPSIEQMQGEITNAWITNVPIYTKGKFWDKVSKESKTNAPVSIEDRFKNFDKENSIFTNNDIREKNDEGAFSLPSQKAKVKVSPIEERQSIDDDKSRRESITEGDDEENVQIHEFKVKNTQHEKQTVSETIDETKEERQEYSRTDDNAVEIKSAFPSYTTNPPQPASKDEKKEDERSVKDETEDQKDESENDKGVKSVITSYATDFRRPQSDDNERKENESPAADETEDEEDETDEEVSPLTSVRQKDGTVFSHEEMQHKREQLQKNESLSDTKQVEDQDDIQRRNEVDRESQPDTVQNRTQHQSHTDKSEGDDGSKSLTTVNHDHHEAAVNEDTRRVNHDYKDDQQEKNSKDSTEENKGGNGNVHGQESNPMDNRKRKTKDNEDETKESEDNDEHNENPQKADDVSKQKRDIDQRQRKDKNEVTDNEDARGEMQGKEMQGKEQQSMTEEETRKQHAQHQQQPEQQEKTQQQLQQQQQQFHHHHQQQQFHQQQQLQQQQPLQQQLHQQQQHQQLHQQQQQRLQQQQPLQQQLHQQQEQKQLHQQQQQQRLHQQQQQPLQQQQPHQQKEQQQPFQQDQQQVHQQEQQQQVHQQQQSLLHRQQLQQQQVQLQIQQQQKQLQQQQPHQQLQPQQLQRQQQKQHKEGSDNNDSERQTETDKQRNGNQVKGQEESNDLKARESKREKQSRNPSERQEIEKEEEKRQPVKEKQQNRKPSERQEKVEEEEARKQEKQEQQNRKPSERQEKTAKLEEEGRQQANEEKQNENLQQERKVASKERTQAQEDKRLNHENSDENIERNQQEEEQSRKRGRGSESLKRRENEKNANQETGRKDESSLQHPLMPSATKKTGILKQLPLIDMEDLEDKRPKVLIVIFVLSSALRYDRRQAIRDSWWTKCKEPQAACMFVTDGYIDETLHDGLLKEKQAYNDILFLPVDEGLNFGMRLLFLMEWVQAKYNPEFFLRIDDDYFLCIERLLHELPQRPKTNLVWGFWHCDLTTVVFIDESFILLSYDLVEKFLSWDEKTLLCHPFGDQQLGIWLNSVPTFKGFFDARLHHDPPASKNSTIRNLNNICDRFLGLHGTYPEDMRRFWLRGNDGKKTVTKLYPLYPNACHYRPYFKWQDIKPSFRYKPELCNKNPRWENKREMWTGRQ